MDGFRDLIAENGQLPAESVGTVLARLAENESVPLIISAHAGDMRISDAAGSPHLHTRSVPCGRQRRKSQSLLTSLQDAARDV